MGAHPSRGLLFRWEDSGAEEEEEEEVEATAAPGSGSRQLIEPEGGEVSGPTAPWSTSPAAACSASRVGEEGGEGRDFFLLEDNSFRRLFFSLLTSLSSRQASAALLGSGLRAELFKGPTGTARTGTGLKASPSKDAALTLGGVREAAAQPIATPARAQPWAEPEEGCGHTERCGR